MAYYQNENEDENKDTAQGMNSQEQSQSSTSPVQLSSPTSATAGSGPTTSGINSQIQAPKGTAKSSSGSGPGFANYAQANKGKAQESLNSAVAQNVANAGQTATNAINQASQQFNTRADQGALGGQQSRSTAVSDVQGTVDSARNLTAGNNVDQSQQDRFKQVINAQYTGPESLRQAGLYDPAAQKAQTAQNLADNSKTATGREELLRQLYQQRGDYTAGLNKLDSALLNASQQGVHNLQNVAQAQGNIGQKLDQAQIGSANQAQNLTNEVKDIRNQSRDVFSEGKAAEEAATEERLAGVIENWEELPEYFRDIIRNQAKTAGTVSKELASQNTAEINKIKADSGYDNIVKQITTQQTQLANLNKQLKSALLREQAFGVNSGNSSKIKNQINALNSTLSNLNKQKSTIDKQISKVQTPKNTNNDATFFNSAEAAMLGINSGEGLYNLGANAIKSGVADKEKLISKDEQARQAALASLAGLDLSNQLDTNLLYNNAEKAGTQTALDALDLAGTRANINAAEEAFRNLAEKTNLTGTGRGKASKGNAFGSKSRTATAKFTGNVEDFLNKAGYDTTSELSSGQNVAGQEALLKAAMQIANQEGAALDPSYLQGVMQNIGGGLTGNADVVGNFQDQMAGLGLGGIADALQGVRNTAGDVYGDIAKYNPMNITADAIGKALGLGGITSGITSAISGIDTGALKKKAQAKANAAAAKDLQKKYTNFLDAQGFSNRVGVADTATTNARLDALQALLANLDKTNT